MNADGHLHDLYLHLLMICTAYWCPINHPLLVSRLFSLHACYCHCFLCCTSSLLWTWARALQKEWQVQGMPDWHVQQRNSKQPALLPMPQRHDHGSIRQQDLHRVQR
jgi:hypothetical protein